VFGTVEKPRLCVYKSNKHIYAQIIDDIHRRTLVAFSTIDKNLRQEIQPHCNIKNAQKVGKVIAELALKKGIVKVVFDRGGYIYHGRVKALAEAAREAGLKF
jgi:large subunit ribosomal protein L18